MWHVTWSYTFVKKWPLEYQMATKTYLPSNICDSGDSSDSSDCIAKKNFSKKKFLTIFFFFYEQKFFL